MSPRPAASLTFRKGMASSSPTSITTAIRTSSRRWAARSRRQGAQRVLRESRFGNHWLTLKLVGVRSNRSAIGARIRAEIDENGVRRSVYKHVNSGGTFGANPLRQTIGLGKASIVRILEVFWPNDRRDADVDERPRRSGDSDRRRRCVISRSR